MDITIGKNDVKDVELLDKMMEVHEEIMIWKIKNKKSYNIFNKQLCEVEIKMNEEKYEKLKTQYYQMIDK